ncbi:MAG: hypothetical protein ACRDNT_20660 [Streptosporangiaceae bacterium]
MAGVDGQLAGGPRAIQVIHLLDNYPEVQRTSSSGRMSQPCDHVDHDRARDWINAEIGHGWASCAITQNGFVRIISQPRYPSPVSPGLALDRLARASNTPAAARLTVKRGSVGSRSTS